MAGLRCEGAHHTWRHAPPVDPRLRRPRAGAITQASIRAFSWRDPPRRATSTMQYDDNTARRTVLAAGAVAGAAAATGGVALAQQQRAKGPRVWLDMDQQELDDAYDQAVYAPNRDQVGKRRIAN